MSFDGKCFLCKADIVIFDFNRVPIGRNVNFSQVYVVLQKPVLNEDGETIDSKTSRMKAPVCKACAKTAVASDIFDRALSQKEPNALRYQAEGFAPTAIERI